MKLSKNQTNTAQYLLDYLEGIELMIASHNQSAYSKKYLIYREGFLSFGTDTFEDVRKLLSNKKVNYSYQLNKASLASSRDN